MNVKRVKSKVTVWIVLYKGLRGLPVEVKQGEYTGKPDRGSKIIDVGSEHYARSDEEIYYSQAEADQAAFCINHRCLRYGSCEIKTCEWKSNFNNSIST